MDMEFSPDQYGHLVPTDRQARLLRMLIAPEAARGEAVRQWLDKLDLENGLDKDCNRLMPYAYERVQQCDGEHPVLQRIRPVYLAFFAQGDMQMRIWSNLVSEFSRAGIPFVLLKGTSMVADYYDSATQRPMQDADVAIRSQDIPRAEQVLTALGWRDETDAAHISDPIYLQQYNWIQDTQLHVNVDVHRHIVKDCFSDSITDWMWARTESFEFAGVAATRLNPTALMAHTLLHGFCWNRESPIRWVLDAMQIAHRRAHEIDWQAICEFARAHELMLRLSTAAMYLHRGFGLELPADIKTAMTGYKAGLIERNEFLVVSQKPATDRSGVDYWANRFRFTLWRAARMAGSPRTARGYAHAITHTIGAQHVPDIPIAAIRYLSRRWHAHVNRRRSVS